MKFIRSIKTNKYFSSQTRKQIDIGFQIAEMAKDELKADEPSLKVVASLISQAVIKEMRGGKNFIVKKWIKFQF